MKDLSNSMIKDITKATDRSLHKIHEKNPSRELLEKLISLVPDSLSCKDKNGFLPLQKAPRGDIVQKVDGADIEEVNGFFYLSHYEGVNGYYSKDGIWDGQLVKCVIYPHENRRWELSIMTKDGKVIKVCYYSKQIAFGYRHSFGNYCPSKPGGVD